MVRPDLGDLKTVTSHFFNAWFQSMFGTEGSTDMVVRPWFKPSHTVYDRSTTLLVETCTHVPKLVLWVA